MAIVADTFETYQTIGDREDLQDVIYTIDPMDTPCLSSFERVSATNVTHEWQTDDLDPAALNAVEESHETVFNPVSPTVRPHNQCQISEKNVVVSGTNEQVTKAGRGSEMAYQLARMSKSLKRDLEFTLTQDQMINLAPASEAARTLASIENWLGSLTRTPADATSVVTSSRASDGADPTVPVATGTPTVAVTDGTQRALLESYVKAVLQATWTNGGEASMLVAGPFNKRVISSFTGNSTRYDIGEDKRLVAAIDVYVSDYGSHRVVPNRFSRDRSLLCLDPSLWCVAYLRPFAQYPLAKTGDAEKRLLNVEWTLVAKNRGASGVVADLTTA